MEPKDADAGKSIQSWRVNVICNGEDLDDFSLKTVVEEVCWGERMLNPKPLSEELFSSAKCDEDILRNVCVC